MTTLTDIEQVRLLIGDIEASPFYPIFDDDQINAFLSLCNNSVREAAKLAAISALGYLATAPTRERVGDLEQYNVTAAQYTKALEYIINSTNTVLPSDLVPWVGGIDKLEMLKNRHNPKNYIDPIYKLRNKNKYDPFLLRGKHWLWL